MILFPAIDIIGGQAVRLTEGDYRSVKGYGSPLDVARRIKNAGATHLHLVDLDGAKDGGAHNFDVIRAIVAETGLFIEAGGGIRDLDRAEQYLNAGVMRVIFGTAAVNNPALAGEAVRAFGTERVAAGVDVKGGMAATEGWQSVSGVSGEALIETLMGQGVAYFIYTDIERDGKLSGTNLEAYRSLCRISGAQITASGGITDYEEIKQLQRLNLYGAIIGKAMYEGLIDLKTALQITI